MHFYQSALTATIQQFLCCWFSI